METLKSAVLLALTVVAAAALLFGTYAAAVSFYASPAIKWAAVGVYAALALWCALKRHGGKAAVFALGILAVLNYYSFFAGVEAKVREGVNIGNLSAMRVMVEQAKEGSGSFPAEVAGLKLRLAHGHPETTMVRVVDASSPDLMRQDLGAWAYDPKNGKVFIACTHAGYKGEAWNSF